MEVAPADRADMALSPAERRRRNREEMVSAILSAARAVMREDGVAALNLQEVARRVHLRAPSLYEYFSSKAAVYDALFLLGVRLFQDRLEQTLAGREGFWNQFRGALEAYFGFAQEHPELHSLVFERHVPGFVPSAESLAASREVLAIGRQHIVSAIETGTIAPRVSTDEAVDLTIAMFHGLASQHLANEPELPIGSGRFGSLIPAAEALFRAAWDPRHAPPGPDHIGARSRSETRDKDE
jgi:AcrR family transcriptional regulator